MSTPWTEIASAIGGLALTALTGLIYRRRRRGDKALSFALQRLEAHKNSPVPFVVVTHDGKPMELNDAACKFLGRSRESLKRMSFEHFTHPADVDIDLELFQELIRNERSHYSIVKRWVTENGSTVMGQMMVRREENGDPTKPIITVEIVPIHVQEEPDAP